MTLIPRPNGTFAEPPGPKRCAGCGRALVPPNVGVSWLQCPCAGGRGHRSWHCYGCGVTAYRPEHDESGPTPPK